MSSGLDMALDDMISSEGGGRGSKGGARGRGAKGGSWGGGRGAKAKGAGKRTGGKPASNSADGKLDMTLDEVIETLPAGDFREGTSFGKKGGQKGEQKGQGKGRGKGKSRADWYEKDWSSTAERPWSSSKDSWDNSWSSWSGSKGGKGRGKSNTPASWSNGGGKGSTYTPAWLEHDDWRGGEDMGNGGLGEPGSALKGWADEEPEPVRGTGTRLWQGREDRDDDRWVSRADVERPRAGGGRLAPAGGLRSDVGADRGRRLRRDEEDDDRRPPRRAEAPRDRERGERSSAVAAAAAAAAGNSRKRGAPEPVRSGVKRIKVTNVPRDLTTRDIRDAFEAEAGETARCELERGVAWVTFHRAGDAIKAVDTFDKGELNGKVISVTLDQ